MQTFTHGQRVTCTIHSTEILDAKISIDDGGSPFICQNEKDGSNAEDKLGYKYSWALKDDFTIVSVTNLKPAGSKNLDEISVGDVIVDEDGYECLILVRCGEIVVPGIKRDYGYSACKSYTIADLKHYKYTVKQTEVTPPTPTKLTVAQIAEKLGYEVEVIKG